MANYSYCTIQENISLFVECGRSVGHQAIDLDDTVGLQDIFNRSFIQVACKQMQCVNKNRPISCHLCTRSPHKMHATLVFLLLIGSAAVSAFRSPPQVRLSLSSLSAQKEELDSQGYIIKPRDWFNGLSGDPGASLTDPRAVPPAMKEFAERIKSGGDVGSFAETISLIDENYDYFAVPFQVGDLKSAANENKVNHQLYYCIQHILLNSVFMKAAMIYLRGQQKCSVSD